MSEEFPIKGDLGKAFSKIVDYSFIKYLGCFIERIKRGDKETYSWMGKSFDTLEEAKAEVQVGYDAIQNSIKSK